MEYELVESKTPKDRGKQAEQVPDQRRTTAVNSVDQILELQRTIGNRAVARLIKAELAADRVARRMTTGIPGKKPMARRQDMHEQEKEQAVQRTPLAENVTSLAQRQGIPDKVDQQAPNGVFPHAEEAVAAASASTGQPLPSNLRRKFEEGLGADLSAVRLHTGPQSGAANKAISARAYTIGTDVHFNEGQYNPGSSEGEHLLAHEVAHTVQQSRANITTPQSKLEVSTPGADTEIEADRAADALVAGRPAAVGSPIVGIPRKIFRDQDPGYGVIEGAGDEAAAKAQKAPLQVDTISVQTDRNRVGEIIADIDKNTPIVKQAEKANSDMESKYAPLATNTATKANLSVFDDKLAVSAVDTTAFAVQYRNAYADYQRLTAEATEYLSHIGVHSDDALDTLGTGFSKASGLKLGAGQAGLDRFRAARRNMNTAAQKMDGQLTAARGAANLLQGALYSAKAKAAAASGKEAATKLAAVRAEIDQVAGGVGRVVKICSAVAGLAGGGGATNALATPKETGGSVDIDPSISGLRPGGTVLDPQEASKAALLKAMGTDVASVVGSGGGPDKMAETLVKAIGEYANKNQISNLQQSIIKAGAEESSFNAAGDAQSMVGYQEQMDAASKQLSLLIQTFDSARQELADATNALMEELNKGGKKGKDQAKGVLFLSDADRFLAQVRNAISVGGNQQANLKQAATDRKGLRGVTASVEGGKDSANQYYFRCTKTTVPGRLWGTNDSFKLDKVYVTFQDSGGFGQNDINQGGAGTVEGTGSADDEVKKKIDVLNKAQAQVTVLQTKVQDALGLKGGPGLNA